MSARWLGVKKVRLDTVVVPGDFAKRTKEQHVQDLADSIAKDGVISLPVVNAKTRRLVAGGDRLAALQILGIKQHEVRLVEGTPEELEAITIAENLWRRRGDDYNAMINRLVELTPRSEEPEEQESMAKLASNPEPRRPGPPRSAARIAREVVAKQLGKTPEAVRWAERRARAKEAEAEAAKIPEEVRLAEKPPVTTYGLPGALDTELARAIIEVQEKIDDADRHLRSAQRAITQLGELGSIGGPIASRLKSAIHTAADMVRRERPDSLCPCCKFLPLRFKCTFCGGVGIVSNDKLAGVAPELLLSGDKAMVYDGSRKLVPYARAAAAQAPVAPKSTAQSLPAADDDIPF
jgi:ParB-like chromosome segregation protein Spo0J